MSVIKQVGFDAIALGCFKLSRLINGAIAYNREGLGGPASERSYRPQCLSSTSGPLSFGSLDLHPRNYNFFFEYKLTCNFTGYIFFLANPNLVAYLTANIWNGLGPSVIASYWCNESFLKDHCS